MQDLCSVTIAHIHFRKWISESTQKISSAVLDSVGHSKKKDCWNNVDFTCRFCCWWFFWTIAHSSFKKWLNMLQGVIIFWLFYLCIMCPSNVLFCTSSVYFPSPIKVRVDSMQGSWCKSSLGVFPPCCSLSAFSWKKIVGTFRTLLSSSMSFISHRPINIKKGWDL